MTERIKLMWNKHIDTINCRIFHLWRAKRPNPVLDRLENAKHKINDLLKGEKMKGPEETISSIRQALSRGYCHSKNTNKILEPDLIEAMVKEILMMPAEPNLGCATTGELLDEIKARIEGDGKLNYRTVDIE